MEPEVVTTGELLEQWREASRAAELAERLAAIATEAAERADRTAAASEEIARIAERAAKAAERAARMARQAADRAASFADESRSGGLADADEAVLETREEEETARLRYHDAERAARERQGL